MVNGESVRNDLAKIKPLYAEKGIVLIGVFGSVARGENDPFSDIDVAYTLEAEAFSRHFPDGFGKVLELQGLKERLEAMFHGKVDLVSLQSGDPDFLQRIKEEMIYV